MTARNPLTAAPPHAVERALRRMGADLRTARVRRGLTIEDVAAKIGTGVRAVADAEKGKPSTGVVVYAALLWAYDLLGDLERVAEATSDEEGLARARAREPTRPARGKGLDDAF